MDQKFQEWDQRQREMRNRYWRILRDIRENEYGPDNSKVQDWTTWPVFHNYVEDKYGFIMGMDGQGDYTNEYTVVNDHKFMLFKIKHGL